MGGWWMRKGVWNNRIPIEKISKYLEGRSLAQAFYEKEKRGADFLWLVSNHLTLLGIKVCHHDSSAIYCVAEDREVYEILSGKRVTWKWDSYSLSDYRKYCDYNHMIYKGKGCTPETVAQAEAQGCKPY